MLGVFRHRGESVESGIEEQGPIARPSDWRWIYEVLFFHLKELMGE